MSQEKEIFLIGAGGLAAEVCEAAEAAGWIVTGLYDDNPEARRRLRHH